MSTRKGLLKGSKFNGRHTTVIAVAHPLIRAANDDSEVTKIVVGVIVPTKGGRSGQRRLKISQIKAGLELRVRGNSSVQTFYVYTSTPKETEDALNVAWLQAGP